MKYRIYNNATQSYEDDYLLSPSGDIYKNGKKVDDCIIELFTGVFDQDGKEIWEGDIIKSYDDEGMLLYDDISPVEFYKGSFHIVALYDLTPIELSNYSTIWIKNGYKGNPQTSLWLKDLEVIGNIHENKELLKHDNW